MTTSLGIEPEISRIRAAILRLEQRVGVVGTLELSGTSTTVKDSRIGVSSTITLTPTSQSAGAETGIYVTCNSGSFTVHHRAGAAGRTFNYAVHS